MGLVLVVTGCAMTVLACSGWRSWLDAWGPNSGWQSLVGSMGVSSVAAGLLLIGKNMRRIEHALITAGPLRFRIARAGPDEARFAEFIDRVVAQIRFLKGGCE